MNKKTRTYIELNIDELNNNFATSIDEAIENTNIELLVINETIDSINKIKPECDKLDYILSASSGALCGIIDIFLVGKPGESPIENITDKWFEKRTIDFARVCGFEGDTNISSSIRFLEKKFKIPYDQSVGGNIFHDHINLTPSNHHFKSLGHNPTLLGLFFSILNQFDNTSNFVSNGEFITLNNSDNIFELKGNNVTSKIFCGFINWFGHLFSDVSGSSGSSLKGNRGMGIPSPIWSWTNDIIVLKSKLGIPSSEFNKNINEFAIKIFEKGYDIRFQTAQSIPVFINELIVRVIYSIRRMVSYLVNTKKEYRTFKELWSKCEPFSNNTVKRMLTVAHGTFCLVDTADATVRGFINGGGTFNGEEFIVRFNLIGFGRFAISLYGEGYRGIKYYKLNKEVEFAKREKIIIDNYMEGLKVLSNVYDDKKLLDFVNDFKCSDAYKEGFMKSKTLAVKRGVPNNKILKNKTEIDNIFGGN